MSFEPFDEFFNRMRRMFKELDRGFADVDLRKFEKNPNITGFKIEIRDHGTGKPEIKVTKLGKPSAGMPPMVEEIPAAAPGQRHGVEAEPPEAKPSKTITKPSKPIKSVLETNVGKVEKLGEVVLTVQAPDVKKDDVEIRQLGNTLEVIARKRNGEAYFGAFEIPRDAVSGEREVMVKNGMVIVKIPRQRRHGTRA
jgi:HSP20 family molecular chaperone IbpA